MQTLIQQFCKVNILHSDKIMYSLFSMAGLGTRSNSLQTNIQINYMILGDMVYVTIATKIIEKSIDFSTQNVPPQASQHTTVNVVR